jgi:hypothetical protein
MQTLTYRPLSVTLSSHHTKAAHQIVFALEINIGPVSLILVQITKKKKDRPKRLLRILVDRIPLIPSIPLLGQLPQPFDFLEYMWVNQDSGGLLEADVACGVLADMVLPSAVLTFTFSASTLTSAPVLQQANNSLAKVLGSLHQPHPITGKPSPSRAL